MANRPAAALVLREGDEADLVALTRASSVRAGLAQRARIVLLASQGVSNTRIAELVGVSRPTVIGWRDRYGERGLAGLDDEPRAGRPRTVDHRGIVAATLTPPPKKYGVTHWSSRYRSADVSALALVGLHNVQDKSLPDDRARCYGRTRSSPRPRPTMSAVSTTGC